MDGLWDSANMQNLLYLIVANSSQLRKGLRKPKLAGAFEKMRHWWRSNSKRQAQTNISHHYDLGSAFLRRLAG